MKRLSNKRNLRESKSMNDIGFQELIDSLSGSDYYPSQVAYFIANFYDDGAYSDYGEGMEYWNEFLDKIAVIYHKAAKQIRALEKDPKYHTEETYGEMDKYDKKWVDESKKSAKGRKLNETWAGEDVIADLVDRAKGWIDDGSDLDDAVSRALDDGLIYTKDIRTLAEHYDVLPDDGDLIGMFYEELYGDVYNEASDYYDEVHENNDDEDEENESFKSHKGKKLDEAGKAKNVFDFDTVDIELEDIKELYNEDGVEGVTDLSWENIQANYPEFAKVFKYFSDYIYDDFITTEEAWDNMDEPLYKAVMEFVSGRKKQDPVDLIKKYDPSLKVVLTSDPEPTPEEDEFADDDDFIYDFDDDLFDMSDEERAEMRKIGEFERKANRK